MHCINEVAHLQPPIYIYKKNEWVDDEKQLYMYDKYH